LRRIFLSTVQGQCKPNAIELARIAEVQPVLADFIGKGRKEFSPHDDFIFYRPTNRPTLLEFVRQTVRLLALSPHKGTQKSLYQILSA
jgi:hypothetical protein